MLVSLLTASSIVLAQGAPLDPVVDSFAFFGCNRVDKEEWDPVSNPSSANLAQLHRSFQDIEAINPMPSMLFMVGDMVLGYADDDGTTVRKQLDAWLKEFRTSNLNGKVLLVPIAGNHEVNRKIGKDKLPHPAATSVWNTWTKDNYLMPYYSNGPKVGGVDNVSDDQSRLNFSFDKGKLHFTVLNTDTRTAENKIAWIPSGWTKRDVKSASERGQTTFVLGHRNLIDPKTTTGDSPIDKTPGAALLKTIQGNKSVLGFLCAHVHAWEVTPIPESNAIQVIAGNGGSTLEPDWHPAEGTTFGFAVIALHESGTLTLTRYARPATGEPAPAKVADVTIVGKLVRS